MGTVSSVSVIIPFYNAANSISASLESVFAQTVKPKEVIVVDDFSSKEQQLLLKTIIDGFNGRLEKHMVIRSVRHSSNKGAASARNTAIKMSTAKYLAFLDSDDVWDATKLEKQYYFMEKNNLFLTGHGYIYDLNNGKFDDVPFRYRNIKKYEFIYTNPFFTPTVMVCREGFKLFDESFRRADDYKCWLENYKENKVGIINQNLAGGFKHPIGDFGLTGSFSKMHLAYIEVLHSLFRHKKISIIFYFISIVVEYCKYPLRIILSKLR